MSGDVAEETKWATVGLATVVLLILQLFRRRFTYVTNTSPTSSGEPPMTYTHTYVHTHTHTQTHTHTPTAYLISLFFFKKETRLIKGENLCSNRASMN